MCLFSLRKKISNFKMLGVTITLLTLCQLASAAEIIKLQPGIDYWELSGDEMGCYYELSGSIETGDAAKLSNLLAELPGYREQSVRICLDSPGGNYLEGVRLAALINKERLATRLKPGARCESACAIAFMAGTSGSPEGTPRVDRKIHPTAKLGFHAPGLTVPSGQFSEKEVQKAYNIAIQAISELATLISTTDINFPEPIFAKMLSTPSETMFYLETVSQIMAARVDVHIETIFADDWEVELGDRYPHGLERVGSIMCENFQDYIERTGLNKSMYFASFIDFSIESNYRMVSNGGFYTEALSSCAVAVEDTEFKLSFDEIHGVNVENSTGTLGAVASYPGYVKISNIDSYKSISIEELMALFDKQSSNDRTEQLTCPLDDRNSQISNVNEFTNLRREAGLENEIIARVPLGASVAAAEPDSYLATQRCLDACREDNQQKIAQCISDNEIWVEVLYNGRRGFLSRKFVQ